MKRKAIKNDIIGCEKLVISNKNKTHYNDDRKFVSIILFLFKNKLYNFPIDSLLPTKKCFFFHSAKVIEADNETFGFENRYLFFRISD